MPSLEFAPFAPNEERDVAPIFPESKHAVSNAFEDNGRHHARHRLRIGHCAALSTAFSKKAIRAATISAKRSFTAARS